MRLMFLVVLAMIVPYGFLDGAQEGRVAGTFPLASASITLERTFCHGDCPTYTVTITGDGTIRYRGDRNVRVIGDETGRVEPAEVLELLNAALSAGFLDLQDEYHSEPFLEPDDTGGVRLLARVTRGTPSTILTLRLADYAKKVSFQTEYAPDELRQLAELADNVAGSRRWTAKEGTAVAPPSN